jgi:ribosomal-protein-alanine N-acetyltransferase
VSAGGFRIRTGGAADLAGVVMMERGIAEAPHWTKAEYEAIVNAEGSDGSIDSGARRCLMIAEAEERRLLGFAVGKVVGSGLEWVGEIESVAVDGAARRRGMGRSLCEAVIAWCRRQGARAVELEVRAGSVGAIALYGRLGFVSVGKRKGYYWEPVEDALLMKLELWTQS